MLCFAQNDVIGCLLDGNYGTVSFTLNGHDLGIAYDLPKHLQQQALYPALCLKNAEIVFNFGDSPFKCGPPSGFTGVSKLPSGNRVSGAQAASLSIVCSAYTPLMQARLIKRHVHALQSNRTRLMGSVLI